MIRGFFLGATLVLVMLIGYLIHHLGVFEPVQISEQVRGPYHLLFDEHHGSYYRIAEMIAQIEADAKARGVDCKKTFGEYFDDPREVEEDRLRSRGGCISEHSYAPTPPHQLADIPAQKFVVATFAGSPAIGPWKVYPAVQRYLTQRNLSARGETIEIYTITGDSVATEYLFALR